MKLADYIDSEVRDILKDPVRVERIIRAHVIAEARIALRSQSVRSERVYMAKPMPNTFKEGIPVKVPKSDTKRGPGRPKKVRT